MDAVGADWMKQAWAVCLVRMVDLLSSPLRSYSTNSRGVYCRWGWEEESYFWMLQLAGKTHLL